MRFEPTAGRSRIGLIPTDVSCDAGPRPLRRRIWGVLVAPAERIISLRAETMFLGAEGSCCAEYSCGEERELVGEFGAYRLPELKILRS